MTRLEARKKLLQSIGACFLAFVMILTNVLGAVEVYAAAVKEPTVNPVFYDATTISGGNLAKARVNKKLVIATVHVKLTDKNGTEKATLSDSPTSGTTWKVKLPEGKKVEEGDTVTVYQQIGEDKSPEVTEKAKPSKASTVTLTMPSGEIWIEQYVANIVNADEKAEAIQMLKDANPTIADDIKSVEFKISGTDPKTASYTVTYTDDSKSEEISAPKLTVKKVTEYSRSPEIDSITIVDNVIKGKMSGKGPFDGIKVQLVLNINKKKSGDFCTDKGCKIDKDSSDPIEVPVQNDGTFSYNLEEGKSLELDQIVGVFLKEPHKFVSCSKTTVKPVTPEKKEVKDPRKLTPEDKKAIDAAIRKANTVDGVSKLPNGTASGMEGIPAVIQIDDSGNAKIFSGNDVAGSWDPNNDYKFVPEKNEDGSYKLKDGAQPTITIQGKDLLKNIKPEKPALALSKDKKSITITPNEKDTDAEKIIVTYKDKNNEDKTITAIKSLVNEKPEWKIDGVEDKSEIKVNENGVITLPKDKVKGGTDVTATVTDKGGVADGDTTPLTSEPGTLTVEETKAEKVEALGGLDPVDLKKWVGDTVDWKQGVKAKDSATDKAKIKEYLDGATVTDASEPKTRTTENSGDFEGKVKVTFSDDSEIVVEKQMLYVSDPVNPSDKENLPKDAIDVELKLGEGVKTDEKTGNKETPVTAKTYKVKPGTDLSTEKVSKTEKTCFEDVGATVSDDTYVDVVWKDKNKGTNFKATAENNVFTATATKKFKVTVQANGGTGDNKVEYKKSGEKYTLPKGDTFTPPENKKFAGWLVGDTTTTTEPGTEITITSDTVIKASWKPIMVDVSFDKGEGSGNKDKVSVAKGSEYTLPNSDGFTAPENKEFAGWVVNGEDKKVGDKITVNENTKVTAKYKPIMVDVSFDKGEGSGNKDKVSVAKGSEYTLPNSDGFTAPENKEFAGWKVGDEDGVKAPGIKVTVKDNTKLTAVYKDIQQIDPPVVTVDKNIGNLMITPPTPPAGQELKSLTVTYKDPNGVEKTAVAEKSADGWSLIPATTNGETVDKVTGVITIPKGKYKLEEVVKAFANNQVNQQSKEANATPIEVSYDVNGGSKGVESAIMIKGESYVLPAIYELPEYLLTVPQGKEFAGWEVDGQTKKAGESIKVNKNTVVKALWKDKGTTPVEPSKPDAPAADRGNYLILEKVEPTEPKVDWETGRHYKYLYGYPDGSVHPEGQITRAEAAGLIARLAELDLSNKAKPNFKDTPSRWYNSAINVMVAKDLMFADKNGNFRPNEPITRGEFARALYYIDKKNNVVAPFADVKGHEFEAAINQAYGNGRIAGYPDGSFRPDAYIQRAEAARMLNQYADRSVSLEGMAGVKKDVIRFTDINESHWAYYEVMEAANTHDYRRAKGTLPETWVRIIQKDDRVAR